jgi:hypothetical protein
MRVAVIGVAIALASAQSLAHSSPSCMTQNEARAKFPKEHLWWHGPNRCWDATPSGRQHLAQRIKARKQADARVERDAVEEKKPEEKKPGWSHASRWREAMSRMRSEDVLELNAPARATASADVVEAPSPPRINWRDRWVEIAQRIPPGAARPDPADLAADAREAEPHVTPIRVMLALLVLLLSLGAFELIRRPSRFDRRAD